MTTSINAKDVIESFTLADNIYLLGTFERQLTIYNQQVRALNFVWALAKSGVDLSTLEVAIVGGGFAGLTAAAGLLKKGVKHVSIFEKRAALLPLQQGSDARWVHPHIYDWPNDDSELPTAALPLLNWNAGRASDVVVQVLHEWESLKQKIKASAVDVFINVKHLRLTSDRQIEWVGEKLEAGKIEGQSSGNKHKFDRVVLAVGFGLEPDAPFSYWRNERLGQPELSLGRRTYLMSGHGDSALVDLFRIRIAQFRQDRILVELFGSRTILKKALQDLKQRLPSISSDKLYDEFERIANDCKDEFGEVLNALRDRLRSDTAAILRMNNGVDRFEKAFKSPASFQNRFLFFTLYKAGGLIPTSYRRSIDICAEYGIQKDDIIRRHGPKRRKGIENVLDSDLLKKCEDKLKKLEQDPKQPSEIGWKGGYWDEDDKDGTPDKNKFQRKEHLPEATKLIVTGFISAVAGFLEASGAGNDFRVTLHRITHVASELLLQQSCQYIGATTHLTEPRTGEPARVFQLSNGTIGYAARKAIIVRTRPKAPEDDQYKQKLGNDTNELKVEKQSQKMSIDVQSILALPILGEDRETVLAVLFADSTIANVFTNECIQALIKMCQNFAEQIGLIDSERVHNFPMRANTTNDETDQKIDFEVLETTNHKLPYATKAKYLNIEFTDFISVTGSNK